jgi:hypothetical protein
LQVGQSWVDPTGAMSVKAGSTPNQVVFSQVRAVRGDHGFCSLLRPVAAHHAAANNDQNDNDRDDYHGHNG